MTRDEILNMEAGREMDALIHVDVMKKKYRVSTGGWDYLALEYADEGELIDDIGDPKHWPQYRVPPYSTDIAAAWQVVEKLHDTGWHFSLSDKCKDNMWLCEYFWVDCTREDTPPSISTLVDDQITVLAPTAPLAICRAALLAVMA